MGKQTLHRYICEQCEGELIGDRVPRGWVRLLSTSRGTSTPGIMHNSCPPAIWTPGDSESLPDDGYWCTPGCLAKWVKAKAEAAVERAKLQRA